MMMMMMMIWMPDEANVGQLLQDTLT